MVVRYSPIYKIYFFQAVSKIIVDDKTDPELLKLINDRYDCHAEIVIKKSKKKGK